jgi:four helix bundle protein
MKITRFEELNIWKLSLKITKVVYDLTSKKEFIREFALKDQIRRAAVSISSNIVEGFEKNNNNEFIRYLKIAKGSVGELRNQIYICRDIKYISLNEFKTINSELMTLASQIGAFIYYLSSKRTNKEFKNK